MIKYFQEQQYCYTYISEERHWDCFHGSVLAYFRMVQNIPGVSCTNRDRVAKLRHLCVSLCISWDSFSVVMVREFLPRVLPGEILFSTRFCFLLAQGIGRPAYLLLSRILDSRKYELIEGPNDQGTIND